MPQPRGAPIKRGDLPGPEFSARFGRTPALGDLPGGLGEQIGLDEAVEIAVEDPLCVALLDVGAVVLDELVRVQDVAADLAAEAGVHDDAALGGELGLPLLELVLGEAALEDAHRGLAVGQLRTLVLALDD